MLYTRWQKLASLHTSVARSTLRRIARLPQRIFHLLHRPANAAAPVPVPVACRMQCSAMPWRMNLVFAVGGLAAALAAGGCGPTGGYVAADRATYDAVAPEYATYIAADPSLSPAQRQRRQNTLETWKLRLDAAQPQSQPPTLPATGN